MIAEIAATRSMATSTIEGHLAYFVKTGELDVFKLMSNEKFEMIKQAILSTSEPGLGPVRSKLGDGISYADIRFVLNAVNRKK